MLIAVLVKTNFVATYHLLNLKATSVQFPFCVLQQGMTHDWLCNRISVFSDSTTEKQLTTRNTVQ